MIDIDGNSLPMKPWVCHSWAQKVVYALKSTCVKFHSYSTTSALLHCLHQILQHWNKVESILNFRCSTLRSGVVCREWSTYVKRSRGISRKSNMWHSGFYLIEFLIRRYILVKQPPELNQWFYEVIAMERSSKQQKTKRNAFFFLAGSHNQCYRLPTDPARSQHILVAY